MLSLRQDKFISFNNSLKKIEIYMETKSYKKLCKEAVYAEQIINKNYLRFKKLEPNYDWNEIKKLMQAIPIQICQYKG